MTEIFPFVVLAIVLAIVLRGMVGLTDVAARSGRLQPLTISILVYAPVAAFAVWIIGLVWRMAMHEGGFSLWPFELAVAVVVWLAWIAVVALVVAVHEQVQRWLCRGRGSDT